MTPIELPDNLIEPELKEIAQRFHYDRWKVFVTDEDRARNPNAFGMTVSERDDALNQAEEWFNAVRDILLNNYEWVEHDNY